MKPKLWSFACLLIAVFLVTGCGGLPPKLPELDIKIGPDEEAQRQLTEINETGRRVNETLAKATTKLTPEILNAVDHITEEFKKFNESGVIGEDGLLMANRLVNLLDKGLEVGLDSATLQMAEDWGTIINAQPDKWEHSLGVLIETLGVVGSDLSGKIAQDLTELESKVANDIQGLTAGGSEQVRCTIDFAGQEIDEFAERAGPKFVAGILPFLSSVYENKHTIAEIPGVCVINPYEMSLVWKDGALVPADDSRVIQISGFNITSENIPSVAIFPEDEETPYPIPLIAKRETDYHLTVNLEGEDKNYTDVAQGAVLVIKWSDELPDLVFRKTILVESPCYTRATFVADTQQGIAPLTVQFVDHSPCDPNIHAWKFGDGGTSSEKSPRHDFEEPGVWTVSLTVDNDFKQSDTITMTDFITVTAPLPPVPDFVADKSVGEPPLEIQFTGISTGAPVSWLWEFSDGQKSTEKSPKVTFSRLGPITVRLTVKDAYEQPGVKEVADAITVVAPPPPVPDLVANKSVGELPLEIQFTGISTGAPVSWLWEFSDGQKSTEKSPRVTFSSPGPITVRLTVEDAYGQPGVKEVADAITVVAPPPAPEPPTPTPLPRTVTYEVVVKTSCEEYAGGDEENAYLTVRGKNGESEEILLSSPGIHNLERCDLDRFFAHSHPSDLGDLTSLKIRYNDDEGWLLEYVTVINQETDQEWFFPCSKWLDSDDEGNYTERTLYPGDSGYCE